MSISAVACWGVNMAFEQREDMVPAARSGLKARPIRAAYAQVGNLLHCTRQHASTQSLNRLASVWWISQPIDFGTSLRGPASEPTSRQAYY